MALRKREPTKPSEPLDPSSADTTTLIEFATPAAKQASVPMLGRRDPFLLQGRATSFQVVCGRIVPCLVPYPLVPGIGQTRYASLPDGTKRLEVRTSLGRREDRGWITIPQEVDAPEFKSYLQKVPGTQHHMTRWETAYPGSSVVTDDPEAYTAWCESLVTRGYIPAPTLGVLGLLADKISTTLNELKGMDPERSERLRADLEIVRTAMAKLRKSDPGPIAEPIVAMDI